MGNSGNLRTKNIFRDRLNWAKSYELDPINYDIPFRTQTYVNALTYMFMYITYSHLDFRLDCNSPYAAGIVEFSSHTHVV